MAILDYLAPIGAFVKSGEEKRAKAREEEMKLREQQRLEAESAANIRRSDSAIEADAAARDYSKYQLKAQPDKDALAAENDRSAINARNATIVLSALDSLSKENARYEQDVQAGKISPLQAATSYAALAKQYQAAIPEGIRKQLEPLMVERDYYKVITDEEYQKKAIALAQNPMFTKAISMFTSAKKKQVPAAPSVNTQQIFDTGLPSEASQPPPVEPIKTEYPTLDEVIDPFLVPLGFVTKEEREKLKALLPMVQTQLALDQYNKGSEKIGNLILKKETQDAIALAMRKGKKGEADRIADNLAAAAFFELREIDPELYQKAVVTNRAYIKSIVSGTFTEAEALKAKIDSSMNEAILSAKTRLIEQNIAASASIRSAGIHASAALQSAALGARGQQDAMKFSTELTKAGQANDDISKGYDAIVSSGANAAQKMQGAAKMALATQNRAMIDMFQGKLNLGKFRNTADAQEMASTFRTLTNNIMQRVATVADPSNPLANPQVQVAIGSAINNLAKNEDAAGVKRGTFSHYLFDDILAQTGISGIDYQKLSNLAKNQAMPGTSGFAPPAKAKGTGWFGGSSPSFKQ